MQQIQDQSTDDLWTAKDVARVVRVPPKAVYGLGISHVRISNRRIRYRPEDVWAWIASRRVEQ